MTIDTDTIALARSVRVEDEIARRGIRLRGRIDREGPCPVCSPGERKSDRFSINTRKQVFNCRGAGGGDVIDLVMHLDGCDFAEAVHTLTGTDPFRPPARPDPVRIAAAQAKAAKAELDQFCEEQTRWLKALVIFDKAVPIENTPAETYLRLYRHLDIPNGVSGRALRYHPACPWGESTRPAMVALVRHVVTDELLGIHRTALHLDGTPVKIDGRTARLSLGVMKDGAVKLSDDADVGSGLHVAEGLETTLASMMLGYRPAWALLSAGNIASFPVLAGIECLTILMDRDRPDKHGRRAGEAAGRECADRWAAAGREVIGKARFARRPTWQMSSLSAECSTASAGRSIERHPMTTTYPPSF